MTNAPIDPRHKDEAKRIWEYNGMTVEGAQNKIAQTLANDEAKGKALARIAEIGDGSAWSTLPMGDVRRAILELAAPYRASDPVADALKAIIEEGWPNLVGMHRPAFDLALAKFRAFIEGYR